MNIAGRLLVLLLLLACRPIVTHAAEQGVPGHLALLAGGGESIPGWGDTTERIKTVDITFRYAGLINRPFLPGWLHAQEQLWIELPVMYIVDPYDAPIYSLNFLFCCIFKHYESFQPYLTAGGGPVYVATDVQGMGSRLCGNYQAGLGVRIPFGGWSLHTELRFHHISNLGMDDPNVPLNSLRGLLGVSWNF